MSQLSEEDSKKIIDILNQTNNVSVTKIDTKYIITTDKSLPNTKGKIIALKKGDIVQGLSISSSGDMSNDSGSQSLTFKDKDGNEFGFGIGYRGFEPFYEEYKGEATLPSTDLAPQTFLQKNKTNLLIVGALVLGYLAYKKFNK
jgi:hypothetical protein